MDYPKLAELLFPDITTTPEELETRYPKRDLPEGAMVTRMGPSPTGFIHLGNLYGALTDERLAHRSGGVAFLRIEDTDDKREVEGAVPMLIDALDYFGIRFDEGATADGETGSYGPYWQSERSAIYKTFVKKLVAEGKAYPCFMTEEEIAEIRAMQEANKINPGIYGQYAKCRDLSYEEVEAKLAAGEVPVMRLRSTGDPSKYFHVTDASADANKYNMGIEKIGSLEGRYEVFMDPYAPAYSLILGHKGTSLLDTGYIYAPYIPLQLTPTLYNPSNAAPVKYIMTRYAKKVVNNRYFGAVRVSGLRTFDAAELR